MSLTRFAAVAVAASVLWGATAGAGGPLHPFKHGFWSGGAYIDDRTGNFTHCSAGVAYDSGINLFVLVVGQYHWWSALLILNGRLHPTLKRRSGYALMVRLRSTGRQLSRMRSCCWSHYRTIPG